MSNDLSIRNGASHRKYCVITPSRNEADHLVHTIESVVQQSIQPACWVIVDDGSSDSTPTILTDAAAKYPFIRVVRREDRGKRAVGPGVIDAFYAGLETLRLQDYTYLCKLDSDLELPPEYFERLIEEMEGDPCLGTVSGKVFVRDADGREFHEVRGDENSVGPSKFYRVQTFLDIGGFARHVGWDGVDGFQCRKCGWIAKSIMRDDLKIIHRRQMGSSDQGVLKGRMRGGEGLWFIGNSLIYVIARSLARWKEPPMLIGPLFTLRGYLRACFTRQPRFGDDEYRRQLQRFEKRALLYGKSRALQLANEEATALRSIKADQSEIIGDPSDK